MGLVQKRPRPHHVLADPKKQQAFIDRVKELKSDPNVDIWFHDETGFWADPPPYRVWAFKGTTPILPRIKSHDRCNVMGAVRPSDGTSLTLIIGKGNSRMLQIFVRELHRYLNQCKRTILILDNAKFHYFKGFDWGNIEPMYLPAYSPELNPIEELWLQMKKTYRNNWKSTKKAPLDEQVFEVLKSYDRDIEKVASICAMSKY